MILNCNAPNRGVPATATSVARIDGHRALVSRG